MKILVTGNKGMLGRDLMPRLEQAGFQVTGVDIEELDITKVDDVMRMVETCEPRFIINCAAYTAVDKAESEPDLAFAVNRDGPANLARACRRFGIPLIHISTDYVFDGRGERPYKEDDLVNPLGVYGLSKWEGEDAVRSILANHFIVRTSWLFGKNGNNFVRTILRLSREREELRIVSDQEGCPTWTGHLADALVTIAERINTDQGRVQWGTYHYCGENPTTWCDFAQKIIEQARLREKVRVNCVLPITTPEYPTPATRPMYSVLDCSKMERMFGISQKDWAEGLPSVIRQG